MANRQHVGRTGTLSSPLTPKRAVWLTATRRVEQPPESFLDVHCAGDARGTFAMETWAWSGEGHPCVA